MEWFGCRVRESRYILSEHAMRSLVSGEVGVLDIEAALLAGNVLEERFNSMRGTSYLVCGESNGKPVHVKCAADKIGGLVVIFAYVPALPFWESPMRRSNIGGSNVIDSGGTCFFCGGAMTKITMGSFDYRREGQLCVIKKLPAILCQQCGEKYLEAEVGRKLNALIDEKKFSHTEQANVIDYE
ncbi:MAG: hypothetical protein VR68_09580 [Peptococcaceae bacterium BRH_c4a]|nr:MAG: hypothetical protein VR68_09580 [Peptococcaceae bacterium BRH_c4a]